MSSSLVVVDVLFLRSFNERHHDLMSRFVEEEKASCHWFSSLFLIDRVGMTEKTERKREKEDCRLECYSFIRSRSLKDNNGRS